MERKTCQRTARVSSWDVQVTTASVSDFTLMKSERHPEKSREQSETGSEQNECLGLMNPSFSAINMFGVDKNQLFRRRIRGEGSGLWARSAPDFWQRQRWRVYLLTPQKNVAYSLVLLANGNGKLKDQMFTCSKTNTKNFPEQLRV